MSSKSSGEWSRPDGAARVRGPLPGGGPLRIALIYALLASLWILVSDRLVGMLGLGAEGMVVVNTLKGWAFVALTTLILYRLMAAMVRGIAREQAETLRTASLLNSLAEGSTDCIYVKDAEGRYLLFNREAGRFVGKPPEQVVGRDDRAVFSARDAEAVMADDRAVMRLGEVCTFEETLGEPPRTFLTTKGPILDEKRRPAGVFGIARDITERVAADAALRERNVQLAQSNADLEQFAYVASHDLREPLRMVSTYLALLERRYGPSLDQEAHEFIAFAREGALRLDRMVLDLLEFSRVGRQEQGFGPVPLAEVAEAARLHLAAELAEAGGTVAVAPGLPVVEGCRPELERLLDNLLGNAVKYRDPDRKLRVELSAADGPGEWVVAVADNGIGIEEQYFEKIFSIFQRLHTREKYEGTGIGLAICRRIVLRHGGRLWVEAVPGQGSTFRFTLPKPAGRPAKLVAQPPVPAPASWPRPGAA